MCCVAIYHLANLRKRGVRAYRVLEDGYFGELLTLTWEKFHRLIGENKKSVINARLALSSSKRTKFSFNSASNQGSGKGKGSPELHPILASSRYAELVYSLRWILRFQTFDDGKFKGKNAKNEKVKNDSDTTNGTSTPTNDTPTTNTTPTSTATPTTGRWERYYEGERGKAMAELTQLRKEMKLYLKTMSLGHGSKKARVIFLVNNYSKMMEIFEQGNEKQDNENEITERSKKNMDHDDLMVNFFLKNIDLFF